MAIEESPEGRAEGTPTDLQRSKVRGFREPVLAWLLVAPTMVLLGVLVIYPIAKTLWESFQVSSSGGPGVLGFGNYSFAVSDPSFGPAVRNTLIWGVTAMVVAPTLGLLVAALVEDGPLRHKGLFRFCFFAPYLLSLAAAGIVCVQI